MSFQCTFNKVDLLLYVLKKLYFTYYNYSKTLDDFKKKLKYPKLNNM